jgi:hypothetical protein
MNPKMRCLWPCSGRYAKENAGGPTRGGSACLGINDIGATSHAGKVPSDAD